MQQVALVQRACQVSAPAVFSNPRMSLKGKGAGGEEGSFRK